MEEKDRSSSAGFQLFPYLRLIFDTYSRRGDVECVAQKGSIVSEYVPINSKDDIPQILLSGMDVLETAQDYLPICNRADDEFYGDRFMQSIDDFDHVAKECGYDPTTYDRRNSLLQERIDTLIGMAETELEHLKGDTFEWIMLAEIVGGSVPYHLNNAQKAADKLGTEINTDSIQRDYQRLLATAPEMTPEQRAGIRIRTVVSGSV